MYSLSDTENQIFIELIEKDLKSKSSGKTDTAYNNIGEKKKLSQDEIFENEFYEIMGIVWKY